MVSKRCGAQETHQISFPTPNLAKLKGGKDEPEAGGMLAHRGILYFPSLLDFLDLFSMKVCCALGCVGKVPP